MIEKILVSAAVMAGLGLIFSLLLLWASKRFHVEPKHEVPKPDPQKMKEVLQVLPKLNCGRCGYSTCGLYTMNVLAGRAEADQCASIDAETAGKISEITKRK